MTATWSVVHPERPVTIGVPLPTYSTVDPRPGPPAALPHGELGEIGIAGLGLARGYVNRDDLTERAFVPDFLDIPRQPDGAHLPHRRPRAGSTTDGEIEYHGRIDTQVKIRGYRIELGEIESVLLQVPAVAQAAVTTHASAPGVLDLVGYYTLRRDAEPVDAADLHERLRTALPSYMVPAYLERLERMPMLPSDKVDRRSLPPPTGPRLGGTTRATTSHPPSTPSRCWPRRWQGCSASTGCPSTATSSTTSAPTPCCSAGSARGSAATRGCRRCR